MPAQEMSGPRIRRGPNRASPSLPPGEARAVPVHQGRPCAPGLALLGEWPNEPKKANSELRIANSQKAKGEASNPVPPPTTRYSPFAIRLLENRRGRLRAASALAVHVRARLAGCAPASPRPAHPVAAGRAVPAKAATAGGLLDRREVLRRAGNPRAAAPSLGLGGEGEAGEQQSRCE